MQYNTTQVLNLCTGEPFTFEVTEKEMALLEYQKEGVSKGREPLLGNSVEDLIADWEFSHFPVFRELLKFFDKDAYSEELITKILEGFGLSESFILKLLEDEDYLELVKPWFQRMVMDGGRASRTLRQVYKATKQYFSPDEYKPDFC
jgi:hypothetical protein